MKRQLLVFGLFLMMYGLVIARLFYWQVLANEELVQAASDQYYFKLEIPASRGIIVDQKGNPLVTNTNAYLTYAEPKKIKNPQEFAQKVGDILQLDVDDILIKISQPDRVWVPIQNKIDESLYEKLQLLEIDGIGFEKVGKRYYPEASMAAHMIGFVGNDESGSDKGYFGVEGFYNLALKGKSGSLIQEKDARGLPIVLGESKRIPQQNGQQLKLTIDRAIQFLVETQLKRGIDKYGAKSGLIVVMDPSSGGILASATFPSFDPRNFTQYKSEDYLNPLISWTYEPGSTFKTLVMAAALNERVVDPKTTFDEKGPVSVGEYSIRTWNNEYHGEMSMAQVLERSSNPGMVFVGSKLGKERLLKYIHEFGFGQATNIDLEGEESPELRDVSEWREIDLATASFGQGIAVTPLQMVQAVSVLAHDGKLMQPHIVKELIDQSGKVIEQKPKVVREILRPATTKVVTEMMINAVDSGEAKWAKPPGYRIAGKTGTAQIPVEGHYDAEKTIASFVGFAPADNPKFVMLVLLREPTTSPWGSETAAPLFFSIAKDLFSYYGISPKD